MEVAERTAPCGSIGRRRQRRNYGAVAAGARLNRWVAAQPTRRSPISAPSSSGSTSSEPRKRCWPGPAPSRGMDSRRGSLPNPAEIRFTTAYLAPMPITIPVIRSYRPSLHMPREVAAPTCGALPRHAYCSNASAPALGYWRTRRHRASAALGVIGVDSCGARYCAPTSSTY